MVNKKDSSGELQLIEKIDVSEESELVDDLVNTYMKYGDRARVSLIFYYWETGKRINEEWGVPRKLGDAAKLSGRGNKRDSSYPELIKTLNSKGVKISGKWLMYARRFAHEYPDIDDLIKQQDMTWTKIVNNLLIKKKKELKEIPFNSEVLKSFMKWKQLSNSFFQIITQISKDEMNEEERKRCVNILKSTKKKLERRLEELENE